MSTLLLTWLQLGVFAGYISWIVYRFGVLPSVSESWYRLGNIRLGYVFTLFCYALGIAMIFQSNETSPFFFFSGGGLALVGTATAFNWKGAYTDKLHGLGAVIGISGALAGLGFEYNNPIPAAVFLIGTIAIQLSGTKNKIWWIEMLAFVSIIAGLFYRFIG